MYSMYVISIIRCVFNIVSKTQIRNLPNTSPIRADPDLQPASPSSNKADSPECCIYDEDVYRATKLCYLSENRKGFYQREIMFTV